MRHGQMRIVLAGGALLAAALAGCQEPPPLAPSADAPAGAARFEALWDASQTVLGRYQFPIDRVDRRAGLITTGPITGQYVTEFWRRDAATDEALAEGTLQTIYRSAEVRIRREADGEFRPEVRVQTQRSNRAMPQITSASEAIALFRLPGAKSSARRMYLMDYGWHDRRPVSDLGRDPDLEAKLLADIQAEAARLAPRAPPAGRPLPWDSAPYETPPEADVSAEPDAQPQPEPDGTEPQTPPEEEPAVEGPSEPAPGTPDPDIPVPRARPNAAD